MRNTLKLGALLLVCAFITLTSTLNVSADQFVRVTVFQKPDGVTPWGTRAVSQQINITSERNEILSEIRFTKGGNATEVAFCDVVVTDQRGVLLGTDKSPVPNYPRSFGKGIPNVANEKSIGLGIPIKANQDNILTIAVDTWGLDVPTPEPTLQINITGFNFAANGITQGVDAPQVPFVGAIHRLGSISNIGIYDVTQIPSPMNIALGGSMQFLGAIQTRAGSEEWTGVDTMPFSILASQFANPLAITSVVAADMFGHVIAGPVDGMYVSESGVGKFAFRDRIRIPPNTTGIYFYGNVGNDFSNSGEGTVSVATNPSEWTHVRGEKSGLEFSMTRFGLVIGSTMQVKPARMTITAQGYESQNVLPGSTNVTVLTYTLDASDSGEDIKVSALPYTFWTPFVGMKQNVKAWFVDTERGKVISPEVSPASFEDRGAVFITDSVALNYPNGFTVTKGTKKTVALRVNFGPDEGVYAFAFIQGWPSVSGATTGRSIIPSVGYGWSIFQTTRSRG